MANTASSKKRARQAEKHRQHNASHKSAMRTAIKNVLKAILSGDKSAAKSTFTSAQTLIDRTAGKGLIHKNKAARLKSRLNTKVKQLVLG